MNIKSLSVHGFKSFCHPTTISFHRGLNSIVGPNGCGKSNISDAFKWVMGEGNIRELRGDRLEDIIFAGSREYKPLGMAEVSMIIETAGGAMPAQYADFTEIEITRRVYRSGETECFINKKPCLLKDIREIFMDTGLNPRAYSIIEQGSIMDIVKSSPTELRRLLEEAAGITKFRERRTSTLRKLEATRENLARVSDIIGEVGRQVKSVQRQAGEARKYLVFQKELKKIEAALFHRQNEELKDRRERVSERHGALAGESEDVRHRITVAEAGIEEVRTTGLSLEKELNTAQEAFYRAAGRLDVAENQVRHLEERLADQRRATVRNTEETAQLTARIEAQAAEARAAADDLARTVAVLAEIEPALGELLRDEAAREAQAAEKRARHEKERQELTAVVREKRTLVESVTSTEARLGGDERFIADYAAEAERLTGVARELAGERVLVETEAATVAETLAEAAVTIGARKSELAGTETRLKESAGRIEEGIRSLAAVQSRHHSLENVQKQGENLRAGSRRLYQLASAAGQNGNFIGVLGHLIEVEGEYRRALETALSDRLEAVLVKGGDRALALAGNLKKEGVGGATVVPDGAWADPGTDSRPAPKGTLGAAWDFVKTKNGTAGLIRHLLRDVYLVPDLARAMELRAKSKHAVTYCTLDGDIVHAWGGVTVGGEEASSRSVLWVAGELKKLSREAETIRRALTLDEEEAAGLKESVAALREELTRLEEWRLREESRGQAQRQRIVTLDREHAEVTARAAAIRADVERRVKERDKDTAGLETARERLGLLDETEKKLAQAVESYEREAAGTDETRREIGRRIAELEVRKASALEKRRSGEETVERLRRGLAEARGRCDELDREAAELNARAVEAEQGITAQRETIAALKESSGTLGVEVERLQKEHRELTDGLNRRSDELKKLRLRLDEVSAGLTEAGIEMADLKARMEEIADRALAETGFSFTPEQLAELALYMEAPVEEVRERAQRMKTRLAKVGPVNMAAVDEIGALRERLTFLTTQKDDLEKAIESLNEAIRKINRQSREMFADTFTAVAAKFASTFKTLFNGGEAVLSMDEGVDLLEAGIHIFAQPPGKKMTKLNLLSGGEKAMTAIALLVALFAVRPSPFCIMDEVDAPLDEANVERFVRLVTTEMAGSQLVLVTHNKQTMEKSDNLVGVTMETPGVSKLVTVQLSEVA
jgi:chromosome segregation protein